MQNPAQTIKTGIFRPGKNSTCFKFKFEIFREGNSDHLLSVDVEFFFELQVNTVQNGP